MTHRTWMIALAAGFSTSMLLADPGVIKTRDGNVLQGDISTRGDNVVITSHGIESVVAKADVESITPTPSDGQLRKKLDALDKKDAAGRIVLARQGFEQKDYEFSRDALEQALAIDPNNLEAAQLLDTVQSQMRMERNRTLPTTAAEDVKPPLSGQAAVDRRALLPTDIEMIRQKELRPNDPNARVRFDGDVKRQFAISQNMAYSMFDGLPDAQKAVAILDGGDDAMKQKVHIVSDPAAIMEFRRNIQPIIVQTCATSNCHGGPAGGGLVFLTGGNPDAMTYTNFYILQSFSFKPPGEAAGGVFGNGSKTLIDRGHGDNSILVNYALPTSIATFDHPNVNGKPITPVFPNRGDAKCRVMVDWMDHVLTQVAPDYGIHYSLPGAVTQPSQPTQ